MNISILTLFPDMFSGPFDYSIIKRAKEKGVVSIELINIRDFATDRYKSVDDHPYGGGTGMILRVDVVDRAINNVKCSCEAGSRSARQMSNGKTKSILMDPRGTTFSQKKAREFARLDNLILVCGRYEGVDERVKSLVDESISIGDYVLTGGELPAMIVVDSIVRLIPGVLANQKTIQEESFSEKDNPNLLEYPQYTKPAEYNGMEVPPVLVSGNHKNINFWRKNHQRLKGFSFPVVG